jgi:Protein of unknown function (DUF4239)
MDLLDGFSVFTQATIVALVFGGLTIGGLLLVRWFVQWEHLRENHDVAGFTFGVIGAFYGVVLAFVIVAVWERFERAENTAQQEALALANLYNLASGFHDPMRRDMQNAVRNYTRVVLNDEWQAMATNNYGGDTRTADQLWNALIHYKPADAGEQTLVDKSIDQMAQLNNARRLRYVYYSEDLPSVIWIVIYAGCLITIGFTYFFGIRRIRDQALMCGTFAALIGLTILAISELATPYSGAIHVSSQAFDSVLAGMATPTPSVAQAPR